MEDKEVTILGGMLDSLSSIFSSSEVGHEATFNALTLGFHIMTIAGLIGAIVLAFRLISSDNNDLKRFLTETIFEIRHRKTLSSIKKSIGEIEKLCGFRILNLFIKIDSGVDLEALEEALGNSRKKHSDELDSLSLYKEMHDTLKTDSDYDRQVIKVTLSKKQEEIGDKFIATLKEEYGQLVSARIQDSAKRFEFPSQ